MSLLNMRTAGTCCDLKISNFEVVAESVNTGYIEVSEKLGIRDCDHDFDGILSANENACQEKKKQLVVDGRKWADGVERF